MTTKQPKRSSFGGKAPRGILVEKRQCTSHREYAKISDDGHRLIMNFSLKVAKHILQKSLATAEDNENVVCSPLSIDAVLNIIALGAKGATLEQLLELTERNGVHDFNVMAAILAGVVEDTKGEDGAEISFVNTLWVDQRYPLKPSFQQVLKDSHKGEARVVDFMNQVDEVVKEVNLWAEKQSRGLIKQLLSKNSISRRTTMLLANALYFKGTWVEKFKTEATKDGDFYLLNGDKVQVPFMNLAYDYFDHGYFESCHVLRMLYEEEEEEEEKVREGENTRSFSMYIFLPEEKDGLPNVLDKILTNASFFKDNLELQYEKIDKLSLPKFEFECDLSLTEPMKQLGLTLPFDEDCKDLTGIVDSPTKDGLYVSEVIQKCRVEVDEEGTKAAAFTYAQLFCGAARPPTPPPPITFVADHPFLFMIREDNSGAILFVGTMLNPLAS